MEEQCQSHSPSSALPPQSESVVSLCFFKASTSLCLCGSCPLLLPPTPALPRLALAVYYSLPQRQRGRWRNSPSPSPIPLFPPATTPLCLVAPYCYEIVIVSFFLGEGGLWSDRKDFCQSQLIPFCVCYLLHSVLCHQGFSMLTPCHYKPFAFKYVCVCVCACVAV